MRGAGRSSDQERQGTFVGNGGGIDATFAAATMGVGAPVDDGLGDQGADLLRLDKGLLGLSPTVLSVVGAVLSLVLLWPIALADPKPLTLWVLGGGAAAALALTYSSRLIRRGRAERTRDWRLGRVVRAVVLVTVVAVPALWLFA
ncbi:MAG: hypothetical protein U0S36_00605 [Candidatus Nanopelagicales bacterium]